MRAAASRSKGSIPVGPRLATTGRPPAAARASATAARLSATSSAARPRRSSRGRLPPKLLV